MNAGSEGTVPPDSGGDSSMADLAELDFDFVTSTESDNIWCEQCKVLKQELQKLQEEHSLNYSTLKKKIISTDLLIKKYKAKCEDHDNQNKKVEELSKKLDQVQRESSMLNAQLSSSLQQLEPLKEAKLAVEAELREKAKVIQTLSDRLTASVTIRKQYETLVKSSNVEKDKTEEEKRSNSKKLKELQSSHTKQDLVLSKVKEENRLLKSEQTEVIKKHRKVQQRLRVTVEKVEKYWDILKEQGLLPKGEKRLRTETYFDSDGHSPEEVEEDDISPGFVSCPGGLMEEPGTMAKDEDSDDDSLLWSFSPIVHALSPLPPSPAPLRQVESPMENLSDSDNDDHLAQQIVDELLKDDKPYKTQSKNNSSLIKKSFKGRLLRRQTATNEPTHVVDKPISDQLTLSEEEDTDDNIDQNLVPETKKLQDLKDNAGCSLGREEDLVRTSDSALHTFPEQEDDNEMISPPRRRVSRIITDSDSDVGENEKKSSKKILRKSLHDKTSKEQDNASSRTRYSLRKSPRSGETASRDVETASRDVEMASRDVEMASRDVETASKSGKTASRVGEMASNVGETNPSVTEMASRGTEMASGKRLTRSMSSPIKLGSKMETIGKRHSQRLSLDTSETLPTDSSEVLDVTMNTSSFKKGRIKTKLDLEKLKRDYKLMQSTAARKGPIVLSEDVNSHLFTRSKSKTILPTSGAKGRKKNPTDLVSIDTEHIAKETDLTSKTTIAEESEIDLKNTQNFSIKTDLFSKTTVVEEDKTDLRNTNNVSKETDLFSKTTVVEESKTNLRNTNNVSKETDLFSKTTVVEESKVDLKYSKNVSIDTGITKCEKDGKSDKLEDLCDSYNLESDHIKRDVGDGVGVVDEGDLESERQTWAMSRQSSTGFVLKASPSLDGVTEYLSRKHSLSLDTVTELSSQNLSPSVDDVSESSSLKTASSQQPSTSRERGSWSSLESRLIPPNIDQSNSKSSDSLKTDQTKVNENSSVSELKSSAADNQERINTVKTKKDKAEQILNMDKGENNSLSDNLLGSTDNFGDILSDSELLTPDTDISPLVHIPFMSETLSRHSTLQNITSSTVVSPDLSSEDSSSLSGSALIGRNTTSACPVSPLSPSPIDFIIPMAVSPLPPSPVHGEAPLSPLPGSPWEGVSDLAPFTGFSSLLHVPSSDNSSDNTPIVTPVPRFQLTRSATPSPIPGKSEKSRKETTAHTLCSFHSEAPSGAIYVKPKAVSNKRGSDQDVPQHSRLKVNKVEVKQTPAKVRVNPAAHVKRRSTDSLPSLVSAEKKPCMSVTTDKPDPHRQTGNNAMLINVVEMVMGGYLDMPSMTVTKATQSLLETDRDAVVVVSAWIQWLVQHLLCCAVESLTILKPVHEGDQCPASDHCPLLTDQELRLLQLYTELQQRKISEDLKPRLLESLWSSLSLSTLLPSKGVAALCRMYTGICRLEGDVESVRVMLYQLQMMGVSFPSVGVAVAGVWPLVLYKSNQDASSLVVVMEHRTTKALTTGQPDHEKMLDCYYRLCNWSRVTLDSHTLAKQFLSSLETETGGATPVTDKVFILMRSLELFFVQESMEFFLIHGGLNNVCQRCQRKFATDDKKDQHFNPLYAKCVIRLAGAVLLKKQDVKVKHINQVAKNLQKILVAEVAAMDIKVCVVETLLDLSICSPSVTFNILHDWYDAHRSRVPVPLRHKIVWAREIMLKKYPGLRCAPFS